MSSVYVSRVGEFTPCDDPRDVQIVLSPYEANVLWHVLYHVGGVPSGPRGEIDRLRYALENAGIGQADGVAVVGSIKIDEA